MDKPLSVSVRWTYARDDESAPHAATFDFRDIVRLADVEVTVLSDGQTIITAYGWRLTTRGNLDQRRTVCQLAGLGPERADYYRRQALSYVSPSWTSAS